MASAASACATRPTDPPTEFLKRLPAQFGELASRSVARIEDAKALHPKFYVDADYARVEKELVFGTNWFAAAHTAELANPGDVKVVDIGTVSIILTRDRDRQLHAFYNICRHRGARVCEASTTNCKQLVCPYHWWSYRLDGSLKATPPAVTPKQRKEELGLERVPGLEVFAGIVFLNQQPNPPPLAELLGDLPPRLARYDLDDLEYVDKKIYDIKGNWKLIAENFVDFYHINAVHPELAKFSRVDNHRAYQGTGQYVGFVTVPLTDSDGPGDSHNFNCFSRITAPERSAALFFQIFPNVSLTIYPHSVYTLMTLPGDQPGSTKEQLTLLMCPGAKKGSDSVEVYRKKCDDLMKFVCNINDEDVEAIENLQSGLNNASQRSLQGEFLPEYDWPVHRFQNMVLHGLRGAPVEESLMPELSDEFEKQVLSATVAV